MEKTVLFFHIGLHKTATSSIQSLLYNPKNKSFLKENNINVLKFDPRLENMKKNIKKNKINVISREGFILPNFSRIFIPNYEIHLTETNKPFNTLEQFNKKIGNLKNSLDFDFEVHIICTLREQASFIESFYLQQVKTNNIKDNFESFKKNINFDIFYYSKFIEELEKFYKVHYLWYETLLDNIEDANFKQFFKIIGLDNNYRNLPVKLVKANININKASINLFLNSPIYDVSLRKKKTQKQISYYKNLFEKDEYEMIYNKFYEDNLKLNIPVNILEKFRKFN